MREGSQAIRAILCSAAGGPEDLTVAEVGPPNLGAGQVRIRVAAAGVNFADTLQIAGTYQVKPPYPFSPGMEVSGTVIDCGADVHRCRPGDRVLAMLDYGGFAEEAVARQTDVFHLPPGMSFEVAAGFPIAYGTSHLALRSRAGLKDGEVLVVHGAAGGVGLTAVEIGKALGATVIATAGGAEKLRIAQDHGADHLIDYKSEDIRDRVKALTAGAGADVVYDAVGGSAFDASLRSINWSGRILVIGFAGGQVPQIPANILLVKNISAIGLNWSSYRHRDPDQLVQTFSELFGWYDAGRLRPHVSATYSLADAPQALADLRKRKATGKLVIDVTRP